jgi:outer membrane receptor protein involved in Fe transport
LGIQNHRAWLVQAGADQRVDITFKHWDLAIAGRTDGAWFHAAQDATIQNNGRMQSQWGIQGLWRAHRTISFDATLQAGHLSEFSSSHTSHWAFSPQGGVRVQTGPCSLRAHAGLFHRFASLAERFGDSALVLENTNIKPERGWNADAGTTCILHTQRFGRYTMDASTFFIDATELVRFLQVSREAYRYENLGKTRATGIELATHFIPWPWIDLRVGYTLTHAVNRSDVLGEQGKPAATIPPHLVHSALTLKYRGVSMTYNTTYRSRSTLDRAGFLVIPDRVQHDLAVRLPFAQEWTITMELLNITGTISHPAASGTAPEALKDVVGYPWPGRTAFVSLQWNPP